MQVSSKPLEAQQTGVCSLFMQPGRKSPEGNQRARCTMGDTQNLWVQGGVEKFPETDACLQQEYQAGKMKLKPEGEIHVTVWNVWKGFLCLFYIPWLPTFSAALIVRKLGEATWDELNRGRSHRLYFIFSSNLDARLWTESVFFSTLNIRTNSNRKCHCSI